MQIAKEILSCTKGCEELREEGQKRTKVTFTGSAWQNSVARFPQVRYTQYCCRTWVAVSLKGSPERCTKRLAWAVRFRSASQDLFAGLCFARLEIQQTFHHFALADQVCRQDRYYAEAHVPTQPPPSFEGPRLSRPYGHQGWPGCAQSPPCEGPPQDCCVCRLPRLVFL